jgi:hypothetical protein
MHIITYFYKLLVSFSALVVLGIGTKFFSEREFVMFGAFLSAASQIGNAFAPNVAVLMATQGFVFGKLKFLVYI